MKSKVLHIIPSLTFGGAERQLLNLVNTESHFDHVVIALINVDKNLVEQYDNSSLKIINFSSFNWVKKILELKKILKKIKPKVIQSWMYHACLISCLLFKKNIPIIWNIRRTDISLNSLKFKTYIIVKILALLSYIIPAKIIYCENSAMESHLLSRFDHKKSEIIFNGINLKKGYPFSRIKTSEILEVGFVGRNVPEKNFLGFLEFLNYLEKKETHIKVSIIGRGYEKYYTTKFKFVEIVFYGEVVSIENFYIKFDFLFSTSFTEGFPNVIVEAMAYGAIPLYTDVGDAKFVANNFGLVMNSLKPSVMHRELTNATELLNKKYIDRMIKSTRNKFSQEKTNACYQDLWSSVIKN